LPGVRLARTTPPVARPAAFGATLRFVNTRVAGNGAFRFVVGIFALYASVLLSAVDGDKALYVGGTVIGVQDGAQGALGTSAVSAIAFEAGAKGSFSIPYRAITALEYGPDAGHRVAVFASSLALFSKKRNHYLTITYQDAAGIERAGVLELGKDLIRTTLRILEVRTRKEIAFQDAEACRQLKTPKECGT
jgi:hypothetical protein